MGNGLSTPGPGVDVQGNPVKDPTENVRELVEAALLRQDDLRKAESQHFRELATKEAKHIREISNLRAEYQAELRIKETERIDAIRAVDVQAVQQAAAVQAAQQQALATTVTATADAFRVSLAATVEPILKSIADLQRAQYETQGGRQRVGETRLNVGAVIAACGVGLILIFGVLGLMIQLNT